MTAAAGGLAEKNLEGETAAADSDATPQRQNEDGLDGLTLPGSPGFKPRPPALHPRMTTGAKPETAAQEFKHQQANGSSRSCVTAQTPVDNLNQPLTITTTQALIVYRAGYVRPPNLLAARTKRRQKNYFNSREMLEI